MDDTVHHKIMDDFHKAPGMDWPIDKYYTKQEEARKLLVDRENHTTDTAMMIQIYIDDPTHGQDCRAL